MSSWLGGSFDQTASEERHPGGTSFDAQVIGAIDTKEFRHYIYSFGNPLIKKILDDMKLECHKKQNELDHKIADYLHESPPMNKYEELMALEAVCSNPKYFDYAIAESANTEMEKRIAELQDENARLRADISDLKKNIEASRPTSN